MGWETYINDLDIPKNWECTSYGNDELPSYQVNGFHIWIDSHDLQERIQNTKNIFGDDVWILEEREIVNGIDVTGDNLSRRFIIQHADNYNGDIYDDVTLLATDNFKEVINYVNGFDHEGTFITDPTMDESGRFKVDPIKYYGFKACNDLNDLTKAYEDFCKKENIPFVDAQEYLFDPSKLTKKQHTWIKGFSKAWEGLSA